MLIASIAVMLAGIEPAGAVPPSPQPPVGVPVVTRSVDATLAVFDRFCSRRHADQSGYEPVPWSEVPADLNFLNTYGASGTFLKSRASPTVYVAHTVAPGHLDPNAIEERCGVAVEGADLEAVGEAIARRVNAKALPPLDLDGTRTVMAIGRAGAYTVTRTRGGWIIIRDMKIAIGIPR